MTFNASALRAPVCALFVLVATACSSDATPSSQASPDRDAGSHGTGGANGDSSDRDGGGGIVSGCIGEWRRVEGRGCKAVLALGHVDSLAVDATNVWWAGDGWIKKVPLAGAFEADAASHGQGTILASASFAAIALGGANVYWTEETNGAVRMAPVGGGRETTLASSQPDPNAIAVHGSDVYWTNGDPYRGLVTAGQSPWTVVSAPLAGGAPTTLCSGSGPAYPSAITVDDTSVYWKAWNPSVANGPATGSIVKVPSGGGTPTTLVASSLRRFAVGATGIYWTDDSGGTVLKIPLSGGAPKVLASGQSNPWSIAVDGKNVYWTNRGTASSTSSCSSCSNGDGSVMKMPLDGGTPIVLVANQYFPDHVAVDDTSIYWSTDGPDGSTYDFATAERSAALMKVTPK